jgi:Fe-S-cluster containining protein
MVDAGALGIGALGDDEETTTVTVTLDVFGEPLSEDFDVPAGPTRPRRLLPVVQVLADEIVGASIRRSAAQGKPISCRAGCGACCRQPVPIARTEAFALREVVEHMPEPRRSEIRARFAEAKRRLVEAGLYAKLRDLSWAAPDDVEPLALTYLQLGIPCPFLETDGKPPTRPEDGGCSIYEDRPIACREYLVTSPAERCAAPTRDTIEKVPLPGDLSEQIAHMEADVPKRGPAWIPLALALEWADQHVEEPPRRTGPELLAALVRPPKKAADRGKRGKRR